MSRRYPVADRYEERESDFYRRPRQERNYEDLDVDIDITRERERYPESRVSRAPRAETQVRERDTVISDRRTERGPRQPDFLREDYGKSTTAGALVIRERDEDTYSRAPTRRRSAETVKSRAPERVEEEKIVIRERERDRGPPYPRSERDFEEEEIIFRDTRERARSRPPPPRERQREEKNIDIDININRDDTRSRGPPRSEAPSRSEVRERDVEEIRFRRGPGDRPAPPRTEVDKEEIRITERHSPPPRSEYSRRDRGRDELDIDIDIRERSRPPPPRERSMSRGALVRKEREEWIIRRRREPSPPPPPPPPDYEKEEIIIRRKVRTPSPEPPPREPTPEPPPPPPPEPIIRPPIIQEVITHHRHIDHGVERARSPSPEPEPEPPAPSPPPPREDNLEIEIRRQGTRNGKFYDEDIDIKFDREGGRNREVSRDVSRRRSVSASTRRRSPSPAPSRAVSRRYDDDIGGEADYYNRKVRERAYMGEAYNGATKDWGLVDIPPGTERVRMDGVGGGRQEITWERYNGERRGKFYTDDRVYEGDFGNGLPGPPPPAPLPPPPAREEIDIDININRERPRPRPAPEPARTKEEIRITEKRVVEETSRGKTKDKMWTEITKDLVIKEAVDEMGYEYEETDDFFYVIEYLRYEDVLRLVELTEDIRRERRERIREIQWEREEQERLPKMLPAPPPVPAPPRSAYDERIYEREYIYDRDGRRYRR